MDKLKECPFCGHDKPSIIKDKNGAMSFVYGVFCGGCTAYIHQRGTEEDAIKAWNARSTGDKVPVPREPTEEMIKAAIKAEPGIENLYKAMIAMTGDK